MCSSTWLLSGVFLTDFTLSAPISIQFWFQRQKYIEFCWKYVRKFLSLGAMDFAWDSGIDLQAISNIVLVEIKILDSNFGTLDI